MAFNYLQYPLEMLFLALITSCFLIPFSLSIRNYNKTGSRDFLIFSGWLFISFIWFQVFASVRSYTTVIDPTTGIEVYTIDLFIKSFMGLPYLLNNFFRFLYASRVKWHKVPRQLWYPFLSLFALSFGIELILGILYFFNPSQTLEILGEGLMDFPSNDPVRLIVTYGLGHIIHHISIFTLFYAHFTTKPAIKTKKMLFTRRIWIFFALWSIMQMVIITTNLWIGKFSGIHLLGQPVLLLFTTLSSLMDPIIFLLMALFLPESMLISQSQIIRASRLYSLIPPTSEVAVKSFLSRINPQTQLDEYLLLLQESELVSTLKSR